MHYNLNFLSKTEQRRADFCQHNSRYRCRKAVQAKVSVIRSEYGNFSFQSTSEADIKLRKQTFFMRI
jgi:hypothetical protein